MAKYFIIAVVVLCSPITMVSQTNEQEPIPVTSLYMELLGNNLQYSLNYDRLIGFHYKYLDGIKIGFTPYINNFIMKGKTSLSAGYFRLYGKSHKFFEVGTGLNGFFTFQPNETNYLGAYINIGYRMQGILQKPFLLRVTFTPMIALAFDGDREVEIGFWGPWAGISLGYTLKKPKIERSLPEKYN